MGWDRINYLSAVSANLFQNLAFAIHVRNADGHVDQCFLLLNDDSPVLCEIDAIRVECDLIFHLR